jgi:hypothetical protein
MNETRHDETKQAPFDTARLDTLLDPADHAGDRGERAAEVALVALSHFFLYGSAIMRERCA